MKKFIAFIFGVLLCISLVGCSKAVTLHLPFALSDVKNIEMFHFITPVDAEKKLITQPEDIEAIYELWEGFSLKEQAAEPVAGGSVTSFRFYLANDTTYEIVYSSVAVKSGSVTTTDTEKAYFTSADIGASWENYDYQAVRAQESELPLWTTKQ